MIPSYVNFLLDISISRTAIICKVKIKSFLPIEKLRPIQLNITIVSKMDSTLLDGIPMKTRVVSFSRFLAST